MTKDQYLSDYYEAAKAGAVCIFTVTKGTKGYGDKYAMRLHSMFSGGDHSFKPSDTVCVSDSLRGVRDYLPDGCVILPRNENDDPVIVESWMP